MAIEVKVGEKLDPNETGGHDFRIPTITRRGDRYHLENLHLDPDWEDNISKIRQVDPRVFCERFNQSYNGILDGQVFYDQDTNLINKVRLNLLQSSSSEVFLYQSYSIHSGSYQSKNIKDISSAIIYQKFLSSYLTRISPRQSRYAFIDKIDSRYFSSELGVPKEINESDRKVTDENFQENFYEKAVYTTGQFSTRLNYIKYNDRGLPKLIQIDNDDCHYILDRGSYYSHNVDTPFQAATLHNIVAEFINEIIQRRSYQE